MKQSANIHEYSCTCDPLEPTSSSKREKFEEQLLLFSRQILETSIFSFNLKNELIDMALKVGNYAFWSGQSGSQTPSTAPVCQTKGLFSTRNLTLKCLCFQGNLEGRVQSNGPDTWGRYTGAVSWENL